MLWKKKTYIESAIYNYDKMVVQNTPFVAGMNFQHLRCLHSPKSKQFFIYLIRGFLWKYSRKVFLIKNTYMHNHNIKFGRGASKSKFYHPVVYKSRRHLGKTGKRARCNKLMGHLYTWLTISTYLYLYGVYIRHLDNNAWLK